MCCIAGRRWFLDWFRVTKQDIEWYTAKWQRSKCQKACMVWAKVNWKIRPGDLMKLVDRLSDEKLVRVPLTDLPFVVADTCSCGRKEVDHQDEWNCWTSFRQMLRWCCCNDHRPTAWDFLSPKMSRRALKCVDLFRRCRMSRSLP